MPTFGIVWSSLIGLFASCSLPANSQDPGVQYTISIARRAKVWMHVVATKECCLTTDGRLAAFGGGLGRAASILLAVSPMIISSRRHHP